MDKLTERIVELVPEIGKLRIGCVLEHLEYPEDGYLYKVVAEGGKCRKHKTARGCENADGTCDEDDVYFLIRNGELYDDFGWLQEEVWADDARNQEKWRVIGRPITLADVLLACQKARSGMWARLNGVFQLDQWVQDLLPQWNLTTDLEGQSDETKAFLSKILGVTHT